MMMTDELHPSLAAPQCSAECEGHGNKKGPFAAPY